MEKVVISLGANLGNRLENLNSARQAITERIGSVEACSKLYETKALLKPGAPLEFDKPYLNACLLVLTEMEPFKLLGQLKEIELELGRVPSRTRWAPRPIDLDIILYGEKLLESESLEIPHPEISNRDFILQGICEIDSDLTCPKSGLAYSEVLKKFKNPLVEFQTKESSLDWPYRN